MTIAEALLAVSRGNLAGARVAIQTANYENPGTLLGPVLAEYLESLSGAGVYEEPSAFDEFISNGDNPNLYEKTIARLAAIHAEMKPATVLDIGCGDGRVTAGVVQPSSHVHLLEPSAELGEAALKRFGGLRNPATLHETGVVELLDQTDLSSKWDLVQSTFAMHTIPPQNRLEVLRRLRRRTKRFVFVEFDVPAFEDHSPEHADYAATRYELGLAEYVGHSNVVTNFLMPVLLGQFDSSRPRHTFEQPIEAWRDQLLTAGWGKVEVTPVAEYWWAQAFIVDATP